MPPSPDAALTVRAAGPDDFQSLVELVPDATRLGWRIRAAEAGEEALLVAVDGVLVVGVASVRWHGGCDGERPWVYGVEVRPDRRGLGVGGLLMGRADDLCREQGASEVALDVVVDNDDAVRFYLRLGWNVVGPHFHRWFSRDLDTAR